MGSKFMPLNKLPASGHTKGNVTTSQLITWGITIALFALGGVTYSIRTSDAKIEDVKTDVSTNIKDIAVLGVKSDQYKEDIATINKKLDTLLIDRGYNPSQVVADIRK